MIVSEGNIIVVIFESSDEGFCGVVLYFNSLIVGGCEDVRFVWVGVIVNVVYIFGFVCF